MCSNYSKSYVYRIKSLNFFFYKKRKFVINIELKINYRYNKYVKLEFDINI